MKKLYVLFILTGMSSLLFGQNATITKVIETPCSSPFIKTVEIAVTGTIDFANDDIQLRYSQNGNGFDPSGDNSAPNLIDISGLGVQTNTYVYIIRDLALMQADFPNAGITSSNSVIVSTATNGNDAYQLAKTDGTVISQFGVDLEDGTGKPWEHGDAFAERKAGTTETGTFVISDWNISALNFLDDYGNCAKSSMFVGALYETVITLGSWKTLSNSSYSKSELSIFPNPVNNGLVNIKSNLSGDKNIELFDVMGRSVINTKLNTDVLDVRSLGSGLYLLKVTIEDRSSINKILIK
ncbi:T9SS type A sorting domain-containing protein [Litoribaculum gwangyangense]|uniref:Secretion system C-terminal sorting domain-containing protein n=1 Tax=Litoribaculum gwangyangense TaxID=1130722 RepID=A0ABP9BWH8_9FLAO